MNELEALWERLRIMNRSLEEDLRQNEADYNSSTDDDYREHLFLEYLAIRARFDQTSKIMAIVEGMIEMYIEKGDLIVVKSLVQSDKERGVKIDDVYEVKGIDEDGDYIVQLNNGSEWFLNDDQVELVEEHKEDENTDYHALESVIRELEREIAEKHEAIEELKVARDVLDMKLRDKKKG